MVDRRVDRTGHRAFDVAILIGEYGFVEVFLTLVYRLRAVDIASFQRENILENAPHVSFGDVLWLNGIERPVLEQKRLRPTTFTNQIN